MGGHISRYGSHYRESGRQVGPNDRQFGCARHGEEVGEVELLMKIYVASSWKNQHAVEMLTHQLRLRDHEVLSFVENNHGEGPHGAKQLPFDEWVFSESGTKSFIYDTDGARLSDLVIYIGPSGCDAWAEVGMAWASGVPVLGLWSKGEQSGLMRRCLKWFDNWKRLIEHIDEIVELRKQVA